MTTLTELSRRVRKAYSVITRSHGVPIVVYAPNASKARAQVIDNVQSAWGCSFKEALQEVRSVMREPHSDVVLPPRHPLAETLNPKILHDVCHAYGGTGAKAGYRDHFYAGEDDWLMSAALYHCLFRVVRRDEGRNGQPDMIMYQLTDLGRNVARGETKTYPGCWE